MWTIKYNEGMRKLIQYYREYFPAFGIVNGVVVETGPGGRRKTLFTDGFSLRNGKWQAVNAQELPAAEEEVQSAIRH
jgi:hypothetical protein